MNIRNNSKLFNPVQRTKDNRRKRKAGDMTLKKYHKQGEKAKMSGMCLLYANVHI